MLPGYHAYGNHALGSMALFGPGWEGYGAAKLHLSYCIFGHLSPVARASLRDPKDKCWIDPGYLDQGWSGCQGLRWTVFDCLWPGFDPDCTLDTLDPDPWMTGSRDILEKGQ